MVYCVEGAVTLEAAGAAKTLGADQAWYGPAAVVATAGPQGALVWRWEILPAPGQHDGRLFDAGITSRDAGHYRIEREPGDHYLIRCDRVNFPPGGEALTHVHAAPGVRCLLQGMFYLDTGGHQMVLTPGSTWLELGPEEVYARASDDEAASFVRVMIIPREYRGRSTITYTRAEDQDKPKSQQYQRYFDEEITL